MCDWAERIFAIECRQKYRASEENTLVVEVKETDVIARTKGGNKNIVNLGCGFGCQSRLFGIEIKFNSAEETRSIVFELGMLKAIVKSIIESIDDFERYN